MGGLGDEPSPTGPSVGGLGFLLDRVAHSLSRAFADVLAPARLTATGLGLLTALRRWEPLTQSQLADFLGVERQQVLHLVDDLQQRGLVQRRPRSGDRRVWDVTITEQGRLAQDAALAPVREHELAVFAALSARQRRELAEILTVLAPNGRYPSVLRPPAQRAT